MAEACRRDGRISEGGSTVIGTERAGWGIGGIEWGCGNDGQGQEISFGLIESFEKGQGQGYRRAFFVWGKSTTAGIGEGVPAPTPIPNPKLTPYHPSHRHY